MRTIKSIMLVTVLLAGTTLFAANPIEDKVNKDQVTQEIARMLENPNFDYEDGTVVRVTLKVNCEGVLEVVSISTKNKRAVKFIQSRLDRQRLQNTLEAGKTYTLPVTFQSIG